MELSSRSLLNAAADRPAARRQPAATRSWPAESLNPASNPPLDRLSAAVSPLPAPQPLASTREDGKKALGARPATTGALDGASC